jgi:hypothetical protein
VAGRIRSNEKSNDTGNRTRDLPACSIVPQPTTLLRALINKESILKILKTMPLSLSNGIYIKKELYLTFLSIEHFNIPGPIR